MVFVTVSACLHSVIVDCRKEVSVMPAKKYMREPEQQAFCKAGADQQATVFHK